MREDSNRVDGRDSKQLRPSNLWTKAPHPPAAAQQDGGEEERHDVDGPREEEAQREEERQLADDRGAALVVQVVDGVAHVGIG